jgi:hypothetical protein
MATETDPFVFISGSNLLKSRQHRFQPLQSSRTINSGPGASGSHARSASSLAVGGRRPDAIDATAPDGVTPPKLIK